jgi:hypothetical protein
MKKKNSKTTKTPTRLIRFSFEAEVETDRPFHELSRKELMCAIRKQLSLVDKLDLGTESFDLVSEIGLKVCLDSDGEELVRHYYNLNSEIQLKLPNESTGGSTITCTADPSGSLILGEA